VKHLDHLNADAETTHHPNRFRRDFRNLKKRFAESVLIATQWAGVVAMDQ
jgi:hypothetical protein